MTDNTNTSSLNEPLWKRVKIGRPSMYNTPEDLWTAACQYFEWANNNSLKEEKVFNAKDGIRRAKLDKMRPYTLAGLCLYLNISHQTYYNYKMNDNFVEVCALIEQTMYEQKFSGATAELMNPAIIARDLGLKDHQQVTSTVTDMSDDEIDKRVAALLAQMGEDENPAGPAGN